MCEKEANRTALKRFACLEGFAEIRQSMLIDRRNEKGRRS